MDWRVALKGICIMIAAGIPAAMAAGTHPLPEIGRAHV